MIIIRLPDSTTDVFRIGAGIRPSNTGCVRSPIPTESSSLAAALWSHWASRKRPRSMSVQKGIRPIVRRQMSASAKPKVSVPRLDADAASNTWRRRVSAVAVAADQSWGAASSP